MLSCLNVLDDKNMPFSKSFLLDNFMNNKTKQRPKIGILSRLVYNPKKQDNSYNKESLYFDVEL